MKNFFLLAMVAIIIVLGTVATSAATVDYWFEDFLLAEDLQISEVHSDLTKAAQRGQIAEVIGHLCEERGALEGVDADFVFSDTSAKMPRRLAATGLFQGYPDGSFRPYNSLTRAETVVLLERVVNHLSVYAEGGRSTSFSDLKGHWAERYITRCASYGWIKGANGKFRPDDTISSQELIVILVRLFGGSDGTLIEALYQVYGLEFEEPQAAPVRPERPSVQIEDNEGGSTRPTRPSIKDIEGKDDEDEDDSTTSSGGSTRPSRPSVKDIEDDEKDNDSTTSSGGSKRPQRPSVKDL
jgi:hypothetical protein